MTTTEQKTVNELLQVARDLREANNNFRLEVEAKLKSVEGKIEQKHYPMILENEIQLAVQSSIKTAIESALTGYNSPLQKYAVNVVQKYQSSIEAIFDGVVSEAIATDEFKQRVRDVLISKIAKSMVSGVDGSVDKTINLMKQDAVFRSRLTLAVNGLVDEFLQKK